MPTALALAGCTPPEPPPDPGGGGQGDEEAELEPCSTPPRTDWKSFYFEPNRVQPLSPKATVSQLGVNDPKVVDALNLSLAANVRPLKVPKLPGYLNARLKTATAKLGQLKKIKDPAEYAKLKGDIFTPLDLDLENLIVGPAFIDEAGGGGNTIDELWRPGGWPEVRPNPFVDLRVRPAACGAYATAAANQARQRVYRNIQLSQVHTEKHCLTAGQGLTISTSQLQPGVDTVAYLYDSATASMLARNDDAVHGAAASFLRYTNATTTTKCVSALVLNARPSIAGTARVTTTVTSGSAERTTNVEVQLRSFPLELNYDDTDIDFEVALTRYTDLPQTPTTLPLALFRGDELVGFDYDSGVGPAGRVSRDVLASRIPTRALVLGQSVESRDFTFTGAYLPQGTVDALQTVSPFGNDLYVDPAPEFAEGVFPPSTQPTAPPVGFAPIAPMGRVDLVLNHPNEPDRDTDGISAETEAQLCTCDPHNRGARPAAWYPYCVQRSAHLATAAPSEPLWFADTDHDGLTDREEIFGVELDQHRAPFPEPEAVFRTIALPVMGADPLHKDLFLELDFNVNPDHPREYTFRSAASPYLDEATGLPVVAPGLPDDEKVFRGEFTRVVDRMFASGAVADLRNPSGLDGIRVHADIGANPILTTAGREEHCRYSCAADAECLARCNVSVDHEQWLYRHRAFGAWGGGGTRVPTTANDLSTEQGRASWAQFCEVAPHYTDLCPPESATAERQLRDLAYESNEFFNRHRMRYFRYGLTSPYGRGGGQANAGGAFGSGLGAYVVAHEIGHTFGLGHDGHFSWGKSNCKPHYFSQMNYAYNYRKDMGFSSADVTTSAVLNPASVREQDFRVAGMTTAAQALISTDVFRFQVDGSRLSSAGDGLANIDWNLTGNYEHGLLRAPATWCPGPGEATRANLQILNNPAAGPGVGSTPDLLRIGSRLYAFYVDKDGRIQYRHSTLGPKAQGSCLSQRLGEACAEWQPEELLSTGRKVVGLSVAGWDDHVVVAYVEETAAPGTCQLRIQYSDEPSASGSLNWTTATLGRLTACGDSELAVLPVDASIAAGGRLMMVFGRNYDNALFAYKSDSPVSATPAAWVAETPRDTSGATFTAPHAPAFTTWPSPDYRSLGAAWQELAVACGVIPTTVTDEGGTTHTQGVLYCLDRSSLRWSRVDNATPIYLTEKPTLVFHLLRHSSGGSIDAGNLPGQFWVGYVPEGARNGRVARISVSNVLTRATPPQTAAVEFDFDGRHGNFWDYVIPGSGVTLYEDLELGALKGMANWGGGYHFFPFADGSFEAELRTGNDYQVMESGLCRRLRSGAAYCQGPELTVFGY